MAIQEFFFYSFSKWQNIIEICFDIFFRCNTTSPLIVAQLARDSVDIILWEIISSNNMMTAYEKNIQLFDENENSFGLDATFDSNGLIYVVHCNGTIWNIDSACSLTPLKIFSLDNSTESNHISVISFKSGIIVTGFASKIHVK